MQGLGEGELVFSGDRHSVLQDEISSFANIFSKLVGCLFILLIVSFGMVWFLIFKGSSILFSTAVAPICIPTNSSLFSIPSPIHVICCVSDNSHSDKCEEISHCAFALCFPDD